MTLREFLKMNDAALRQAAPELADELLWIANNEGFYEWPPPDHAGDSTRRN